MWLVFESDAAIAAVFAYEILCGSEFKTLMLFSMVNRQCIYQ